MLRHGSAIQRQLALAGIFAATWLVSSYAAAEIKHTTVERAYRVHGAEARSLVAYMKRRPFRGDKGPAMANIRPRYKLTIKTKSSGGTCLVARIKLDIRFVMTLPDAVHARRFNGRTARAWASFRRFAEQHEKVHRRIYLGCARRFLAKARNGRDRSCRALQADIRRQLKAADRDCNRLHDAFDRREFPRVPQLALFRQARAKAGRRQPQRAPAGAAPATWFVGFTGVRAQTLRDR